MNYRHNIAFSELKRVKAGNNNSQRNRINRQGEKVEKAMGKIR